MLSDRLKQRARLSILEKLKQKGTPGTARVETMDEILPEKEETLNDMGLEPSLAARLKPKKKKGPPVESDEAIPPSIIIGGY